MISLVAKVLTTGEVRAHLAEAYGAELSRETISTITDKVIEEMQAWQARPPGRRLRGAVYRRDRAPRGAMYPSGDGRPSPSGRRSGVMKLGTT